MLIHLLSGLLGLAVLAAAWSFGRWQRRRSVAALSQRARFARALDHARDAMLLVSVDGRIVDVNLEAERLSGFSRDELVGKHVIDDLSAESERSATRQAIARTLLNGTSALHETVFVTRGGRKIPVEASGRVAMVEDQRVIIAVVRDVSDRHEARLREQRLQRILRTTSEINQLIVREQDRQRLFDRACQILAEHGGFRLAWIGLPDGNGELPVEACAGLCEEYANHLTVRWDDTPLGRGPVGTAFRERRTTIVPVSDDRFFPWRERAVKAGLAVAAATPLLADGTVRGVLALYSGDAGEFTPDIVDLIAELGGDLGFALAAIERREALAAAQTEAARGAAALKQAAEAMILTDAAGTIVDVNPAFEQITGYRRDEVVGQNPRLLKSGRQPAAFYQSLWARLRNDDVWSGELVNRRKDGTFYTAEAVISAVRGADGAIMNFVGLQRDVTRERALAEQLRQVQRVEELGQLSAGLAHDFNNLLTVILSNLSLLDGELPPEERLAVQPYLQDMGDAARRGSDMIRKLLAVGRQKKLTMESLDAGALLAASQRMISRVIPESIEVRCEIEPGLPPIRADAGALEQMLLNLATNARDAMPSGGTLTLRAAQAAVGDDDAEAHDVDPGTFVVISAEDTGTGMDAATAARVFEPFFTTKAVGKGTGLGLAMVFGLTRQHQGFVRVVTAPGKGTQMRLHFPVARGAVARDDAEPAVPAAVTGGSEVILMVEDEPALRRVAVRCLTKKGYRVIEAGNGEEGWAAFQEHRAEVRLIISDAVMPRLSGPALLARIRATGSDVPFVLSSGYADGVSGDGSITDVPLLPKPWTADDLYRAVRGVLDHAAPVSTPP